LDLLAAFYQKYPEHAERTFLSVKAGCDGSERSVRRAVDNINKLLRGTKQLDLFECARVDPSVPIEETTRTLRELIEEGEFSYIGMSEASSATIRKAHVVSIPARLAV
jgi:pyridoxine 4-dehydrogenase